MKLSTILWCKFHGPTIAQIQKSSTQQRYFSDDIYQYKITISFHKERLISDV